MRHRSWRPSRNSRHLDSPSSFTRNKRTAKESRRRGWQGRKLAPQKDSALEQGHSVRFQAVSSLERRRCHSSSDDRSRVGTLKHVSRRPDSQVLSYSWSGCGVGSLFPERIRGFDLTSFLLVLKNAQLSEKVHLKGGIPCQVRLSMVVCFGLLAVVPVVAQKITGDVQALYRPQRRAVGLANGAGGEYSTAKRRPPLP